ncbi:MAG TPA: dihydrofolate reductase family protein [Rhizomicrobium sp.]|jgi:dihydrofolate reductase
MAKLVYGLNVSLDGYVDHMAMGPPAPDLFRYFTEHLRGVTGMIYGRRMYEVMRYWDDALPDWDAQDHEFAALWRSKPKWVMSRSLKSVGPNATLFTDGVAAARDLKARHGGEIEVAGPELAHGLGELIDEYRLYYRPVVLGAGKPFFAGPRPSLRLVATDRIGEDMVRLTCVPA